MRWLDSLTTSQKTIAAVAGILTVVASGVKGGVHLHQRYDNTPLVERLDRLEKSVVRTGIEYNVRDLDRQIRSLQEKQAMLATKHDITEGEQRWLILMGNQIAELQEQKRQARLGAGIVMGSP